MCPAVAGGGKGALISVIPELEEQVFASMLDGADLEVHADSGQEAFLEGALSVAQQQTGLTHA